MYKEIIEGKKENMDQAVEHFNLEINKLKTGRANTSMVEDLMVDYYGNKTPLKQIASINVPESRLITIQPWDADSLANIESAIRLSEMGLSPSNDGKVIRINVPALTEERRSEIVKMLNKKAEEARVAIRNAREEAWREIQDLEKEGELAEDDKFRGKEDLQEVVDEYNKKIEERREAKEKEIMTV